MARIPSLRPLPPLLLLAATVMSPTFTLAATDDPAPSPAAILQSLRSFRETASVLYVAAHPDDENTQLITYLARGRGYRTAYLSLTRGDGGQNVLGPEFGPQLGLIRTHELLAARHLDGGRQFFTRALDFGFSKDYAETLKIWDRQQILSDIVRVIRTFRPDVMITRFSPTPGGTHGHHTASAVLAIEAFKLAGDPNAFPDQLAQGLQPWQPKRILQNSRGEGDLTLNVSGTDPVLNESFPHIAARSRAMHKSQGFGNYGGGGSGGARPESFHLLAGDPATKDFLDGVDTTWSRFPGGSEITQLTDDAISHFNPQDPAASVPALLTLRTKLSALTASDPLLTEKRHDLDRILCSCLGLSVRTTLPHAEVTPGEPLPLTHIVTLRSTVIPVRWLSTHYPTTNTNAPGGPVALTPNTPSTRTASPTLPPTTPISQPYWLREEPLPGTFRVSDPTLIGLPENPPAFPIQHTFEIANQTLTLSDEPVEPSLVTTQPAQIARAAGVSPASSSSTLLARHLEVIPPVNLHPTTEVRLFPPGSSKPVSIQITASRPDTTGTLTLQAPEGWTVQPTAHPFHLSNPGNHTTLTFTVTAPTHPATATLTPTADVNGSSFNTDRQDIRYPHLPPLLLQPVARIKAVSLDLATRGHTVGYLPGAGDDTDKALAEMGYTVTPLTGNDLTPDKLKNLDAVVIGVRAFNVRTDLADRLPALFSYIENGGTVVAQYNRPEGLKTPHFSPYDLHLSNDRITDEHAPVTFLAPDHPALNTPNKITPADFDNWVQERGSYFPSQCDPHFTPLLSSSDPNEPPLKGSLLIANYGRGHFVYTGLTFFRQLPAAIPGPYRLFANLVSLGK